VVVSYKYIIGTQYSYHMFLPYLQEEQYSAKLYFGPRVFNSWIVFHRQSPNP
jgi:hypothetical protein